MESTIFLTGSISLNTLIDALKTKHSAFSVSQKDGNTYIAIKVWVNEEPDKFGRHASVQLNSWKDAPDEEKKKKIYIGNLKIMKTGGEPVSQQEVDGMVSEFEKQLLSGGGVAAPVQNAPTGNGAVAKATPERLATPPPAAAAVQQPVLSSPMTQPPIDDVPF